MMRVGFGIVLMMAFLGLCSSVYCQTLTYLHTVDATGVVDFLTGVAFHDSKLYAVSFNDRKVIEVSGPAAAGAVVDEFADASGLTSWPSGRGLTGVDVNRSTGDVIVSGDDGTGHVILMYSPAGVLSATLIDVNSGHRNGGVAVWDSTGTLLVAQTGSGLFHVAEDLSGYRSTAWLGGSLPYHRDVAVFGDDFFLSRTNWGSGQDGIVRYSGGTAGDLTGYTATQWVTLSDWSGAAGCGIYYWDYNGSVPMDYIVYANQLDKTLDFYDAVDASLDIVMDATSTAGVLTDPRDACTGSIQGGEYLFVTNGATNEIVVFGIDGASPVEGWSEY